MNQSEVSWHPDEEDKYIITLMFDIGRCYNEYYLFNYGRDLGIMLERLSLTILKMKNRYELDKNDKINYLRLKEKMKNKIGEFLNPKFMPGDLVSIPTGQPCTVMSKPYVDVISRRIVVDILFEGQLIKFDSHKLKAAVRKKRIPSSKSSICQP